MPQVKQMAETDNTVDEKTSIQRQQPSGSAEAHDSEEVDHEFTEGLVYDRIGSGNEQSHPASANDPGDSQPLHHTATVSRGVIWKDGLRGGTDTYETPGGMPAEDYSADRLGNETGLPGDTPAAGDVDPDSTYVAEETGQDGDPTRPGKSHGKPWSS